MFKQMVLATLVVAGAALAQERDRPPIPVIQTSAEGVASARPDRAIIDLGVVTQAPTALAAATQNANQSAQVVAQLKKALPAGTQIQTTGYSLNPSYKNAPNQAPTISGYMASNIVRLTIDDMDSVSKAIDTATKMGANNINSLQFTIKDEQSLKVEALQQATKRATSSAQAMAVALGVKLGRVIKVEEGGAPPVRPMMMAMAMKAADTATPVEAGSVEVRASVTLTMEILQ